MLVCIKTGVHACIEDYSCSVYGDAFALQRIYQAYGDEPVALTPDTLIIRVCQKEFRPIQPQLHIVVVGIEHWFDEDHNTMAQNGTLLAAPGKWTWLGYNGQPLTQEQGA